MRSWLTEQRGKKEVTVRGKRPGLGQVKMERTTLWGEEFWGTAVIQRFKGGGKGNIVLGVENGELGLEKIML